MDIQLLTTWIRARYAELKTAKDAGQSSTELAVLVGFLLVGAGLVVFAIRTKLLEKIGIIEGA
ncbi:LPXTG cell wall anchor domain-containing protein (plasmid) [Streptomyces sp. WA1-19]|uniref:LPXTG cell wall anchor domain-containing protein n=1 Tax=Streptomyces TaxID=1883 RepID=UPI001D036C8B|nr:LPXTG cell wall anchor domain-containing protein [Streptomyces sp. WA1-19]UDF11908.1 LPXTG cell wall anchor domain-containing protein [Streptomyces sp. WA1-19]